MTLQALYFKIHHYKQDRQCAYNVTLRSFRENIVTLEKKYLLHILSVCVCVCSLSYLAEKLTYCRLWPVRLYFIFTHFCINVKILGGGG